MSVRRVALVRASLLAGAAVLLALGARLWRQVRPAAEGAVRRRWSAPAVQRVGGTAPVPLRVLAARRGPETATVLEVDGTVDLTRRTGRSAVQGARG